MDPFILDPHNRARPEAKVWLDSGGLLECHGWALRGGRWCCKRVQLQPGDLAAIVVAEVPRKTRRSRFRQAELF